MDIGIVVIVVGAGVGLGMVVITKKGLKEWVYIAVSYQVSVQANLSLLVCRCLVMTVAIFRVYARLIP